MKATLKYNKQQESLTYQHNSYIISIPLQNYDSIEKVISFENGFLSLLMNRDEHSIEEQINLNFHLRSDYLLL